jgi:hypothetical protein
MEYKSVIFLDFDGVLNCQLFYDSSEYHPNDFQMDSQFGHNEANCSPSRIKLLNQLCIDTNAFVVVSATLRNSYTVKELRDLFYKLGGTFEIEDKTDSCKCRIRGVEIHNWLVDNSQKYFGVPYYDFSNYAIIDDDSDMLLEQYENFFYVDNYSGLTPTICYKIKRFLTGKTF